MTEKKLLKKIKGVWQINPLLSESGWDGDTRDNESYTDDNDKAYDMARDLEDMNGGPK